jgi:hypothetical protein
MQVPSAYLPPEPSQVAAVLAQLESGRASAAIVMLKRRAAETTRSSCFSIIVRLGGVERLTEPEWPGGCLRIGKTVVGVQDLRLRCIMTSYDPDTQVQDKEITHGIDPRSHVQVHKEKKAKRGSSLACA